MLAVSAKATELSLTIVTLTGIRTIMLPTTTIGANPPTSADADHNTSNDDSANDGEGTLVALVGLPTARTRNALLRALVKHMPQMRELVL